MGKRLTITEEVPGRLSIAVSNLLPSLFTIVFFVGWYLILLGDSWNAPEGMTQSFTRRLSKEPALWVFLLIPVLLAAGTFRSFLAGRFVVFDRATQTVTRGRKTLMKFSDIASVEVKSLTSSEWPEHRLILVRTDGSQQTILSNVDFDDVCEAARKVSRFVNKKVDGLSSA